MTTIRLPIVDDPSPDRDAILRGATPLFSGGDDESLACGRCGAVVARSVSTRTLYRQTHSKSARLLLVCACGAYNLLQVQCLPVTASSDAA
jgi:hypothetical protein